MPPGEPDFGLRRRRSLLVTSPSCHFADGVAPAPSASSMRDAERFKRSSLKREVILIFLLRNISHALMPKRAAAAAPELGRR